MRAVFPAYAGTGLSQMAKTLRGGGSGSEANRILSALSGGGRRTRQKLAFYLTGLCGDNNRL
jgi:hypothetical protein